MMGKLMRTPREEAAITHKAGSGTLRLGEGQARMIEACYEMVRAISPHGSIKGEEPAAYLLAAVLILATEVRRIANVLEDIDESIKMAHNVG